MPIENGKGKILIMCGIFGIVHLKDKPLDFNQDKFVQAIGSIKHRGPDHIGHYSDPKFTFGHARLSILDLDPRSNQPMLLENGKYVLTFNGEIYNFKEIKAELEIQGRSLTQKVILKSFSLPIVPGEWISS